MLKIPDELREIAQEFSGEKLGRVGKLTYLQLKEIAQKEKTTVRELIRKELRKLHKEYAEYNPERGENYDAKA